MQCINCFLDMERKGRVKCTSCAKYLHKDCSIKENGEHYCDLCYLVKEEDKHIPAIEFELPEHIRRTYIETYRSCPHKFLKEVLQGHTQPPTCYTQIGIDLHDLFEHALHNRGYTHEEMAYEFHTTWNKYEPTLFETEAQKENMWQRSVDSIDTFYELLPTIPKPFVTEETIHYSIGEDLPLVQFTMDLITENSAGNLDMHDWKTGQVMVGKKLSSDLQAPLYIYGVQKHFKRQVDSFTFYYLKDNKTRTFNRVDDDRYVCLVGKREYHISLQKCISEIKSIFSQIKKGNFNIPKDTKSMFFTCKMCHLKAQGLCQGADEQIWHNTYN